jgi:hypothetical protein
MITVYQANSSIDAKLIQDQLSFATIQSHIMGDLLQGGMGELQAHGLVKVMVDEKDFEKAKEVIIEWEKSIPKKEKVIKQSSKSSYSSLILIAAIVVVILGFYYISN